MATHSSILAWRSPWTEKPGGLQSMRSQKGWTGLTDSTMTTKYYSSLKKIISLTKKKKKKGNLELGPDAENEVLMIDPQGPLSQVKNIIRGKVGSQKPSFHQMLSQMLTCSVLLGERTLSYKIQSWEACVEVSRSRSPQCTLQV